MRDRIFRWLTVTAAALAVGVFVAQGCLFIANNSETYDEGLDITAGYADLVRRDFRLSEEHPPVLKELMALVVYLRFRLPFTPNPEFWAEDKYEWAVGQDFLYHSGVPALEILAWARGCNLALGTLLVVLVGWWAYRLWGEWAAVTALWLAALNPNLVAHSALATTDVGATLLMFVTLYLLWEYLERPRGWLLTATGIALGLALAAKYSALVLPGLMGVLVGLHLFAGGTFALPGETTAGAGRPWGVRLRSALRPTARILVWAVLALLAPYFVYQARSWVRGLRHHFIHEQYGHAAFFLGHYSRHGWRLYFPVAILLKTPLGSLVLIAAALLFWRRGTPLRGREAAFLLLFPAVFLAAATQSPINIGVRLVLPVFPFLMVAASRIVTVPFGPGASGRYATAGLVAGLLGWTAFSSLPITPHQLAYFNELAGGPAEGYRYLSDSNIDWGQDLIGLKRYLDGQGVSIIYFSYFGAPSPANYGIRFQALPDPRQPPPADFVPEGATRELLAISVVNLQGVYFAEGQDRYHWLFQREPVAKIGYSIFVYDITHDADAHRRLAGLYARDGYPEAAALERQKVQKLGGPARGAG